VPLPIYRLTIRGRRKPILVKADSAADAKNAVVEAVSLKADEMADALADGEKVWNSAEPFPPDDPQGEESDQAQT
jgi:hypothetical protein